MGNRHPPISLLKIDATSNEVASIFHLFESGDSLQDGATEPNVKKCLSDRRTTESALNAPNRGSVTLRRSLQIPRGFSSFSPAFLKIFTTTN